MLWIFDDSTYHYFQIVHHNSEIYFCSKKKKTKFYVVILKWNRNIYLDWQQNKLFSFHFYQQLKNNKMHVQANLYLQT